MATLVLGPGIAQPRTSIVGIPSKNPLRTTTRGQINEVRRLSRSPAGDSEVARETESIGDTGDVSPAGDPIANAADELLARMDGQTPPGPLDHSTEVDLPPILGDLAEQLDALQPVREHATEWRPDLWLEGLARNGGRLRPDTAEHMTSAVEAVTRWAPQRISRGQLFDHADRDETAVGPRAGVR